MADSKLTALTELTALDGDEQFYVVDDDDGTPTSKRITVENLRAAVPEDSGWIVVGSGGSAPAFENSWVNNGSPFPGARFRKIGQVVYLDGYILTGSNGSTAFTLPSGYRPSGRTYLAIVQGSPAASYMIVDTDGTVKPAIGGGNGSLITSCFIAA